MNALYVSPMDNVCSTRRSVQDEFNSPSSPKLEEWYLTLWFWCLIQVGNHCNSTCNNFRAHPAHWHRTISYIPLIIYWTVDSYHFTEFHDILEESRQLDTYRFWIRRQICCVNLQTTGFSPNSNADEFNVKDSEYYSPYCINCNKSSLNFKGI